MPEVAAAVEALDADAVARILEDGGRVGIAVDGQDHDLELHARREVYRILLTSIHLGVAPVAIGFAHLGHGEGGHPDLGQRLLDVHELVRLDHGFDLLHRRWLSKSRSVLPAVTGRAPAKAKE